MAQHVRAYPKNMSSIKGLEFTCEADEANLTAKLINLELAVTESGVDATAADYEDEDDIELGHLIFEEFTDDADAEARKKAHAAKQEPFVCKGQAYINNNATNVIVFREKA